MSLRIATGTDGSVKERKGLKRKFKAYAGLAFGLILIAGLFAGCGKICAAYTKAHPNVNFQNNYDSSGTLMAQIKEGAKCNIFFSAGVAQMDELQNGYDGGSVVDGTRVDLLNNQVCLVTYKNSGTAVTSFADISKAKNMALADGTVPVGQYTRAALVNSKMVEGDASKPQAISDSDISKALEGLEINSCANVGAVASAVA